MARPLDPVSALLKLVDACNESALVFRNATDYCRNEAFRLICSELWETFTRFGFELQTEVRRIEAGDFEPRRWSPLAVDEPDMVEVRCEIALRTNLREYESIQAGSIPAHTRAMIHRQSEAIRQLWEQFDHFQARAAG